MQRSNGALLNTTFRTQARWFLGQLRPLLPAYCFGVLLIVLSSLLFLLDPLLLKWMIDYVLPRKDFRLLLVAATGFFGLYIFRLGFFTLAQLVNFRTVQNLVFRMRLAILEQMNRLSADYHETTPVGEKLYRVEQDVDQVAEVGSSLLPYVLQTAFSSLFVMATMFTLDFKLTGLVLPLMPLFFIFRKKFEKPLRHASDSAQEKATKESSFLQEHLASVIQVQLLHQEKNETQTFQERARERMKALNHRELVEVLFSSCYMAMVSLGMITTLAYGGYQVFTGVLTVGGMVAFYSYMGRLFDPLHAAVDIYSQLNRMGTNIRRILEVTELAPSVSERPNAVSFPVLLRGHVEMDGVSFSYRDGEAVLDGIDLKLASGEKIALVGESGSGKTVLTRALTNLFPFRSIRVEGAVSFEGMNLLGLGEKQLRTVRRTSIRYVFQEPASSLNPRLLLQLQAPHALSDNNGRRPSNGSAQSEIAELCFRMGVGEPGRVMAAYPHQLSVGTLQRATIAMGLLGEPKLIIADEPTSAIDASQLTGANNIDFRILKENIDYEIFRGEELKDPEWNPLVYMQSLANSLYLLVARDFAPPEQRIPNLRQRMEGIPRVIAQAKANLQHPPRVHTETAVEQTQGAINLVREGLAPLLDRAPQMKKDLAPLQERAAAALEDYKKWLQNDLLPRSDGNFRLGAEKFRKKLHFALASDLSMEEIMKRAQADLKQTQTAIYETALPLYKKYFHNADSATLGDKHKVTAAVLDKLAEQHPDDATVVGYAKDVVGEATDFVRSHNLVTIPDTPLDVIAMPEFKRGVAIAYCDSPGPLDKTGKTFFAVAPTPKDWSKERKESFFHEYNNYMIRDLTVHEAMPGHFLQLAHANEFRAPTLVRAIFRSGTFIEGWAVYCEQMMAEQGYGGPEVKMQQLKMRLRAIANAILDQSIHAGSMTEKEAMDLMMKETFQQEGEAVAKWKRARLTSAQLSTYFVGATEHLDLRSAEEKKLGKDFDLKKYNDQVISYGSPPVKYVRELMGL